MTTMSGRIPSYGDYERKGQGGPEGTCLACGHQGPADHALTGYECPQCHSPDMTLKLKDGRLYHQLRKEVLPAGPGSQVK